MTKNSKTIQQKITELDELVAWFDGDDFALEEALQAYKKAEALATEIEADLAGLRNDIEVIKTSFQDNVYGLCGY